MIKYSKIIRTDKKENGFDTYTPKPTYKKQLKLAI